MAVKLNVNNSGRDQHMKNVSALTKSRVYVGIPESTNARKSQLGSSSETMNNATLMYIHTHGSPVNGIPARPVIEPALENKHNRARYEPFLRAAGEAALAGQQDKMTVAFQKAGISGQSVAQEWFTNPDNHWAPNAPATIARKGSDVPLIDTGALRQAITNVTDIKPLTKAQTKGPEEVKIPKVQEMEEAAEVAEAAL